MKKLLLSLVLFMFYANPTIAVEPVFGGMGMGMGSQSGWMGMASESSWMGSNAYMAGGSCGAGLTFMSTLVGGAAGFGTAAVMNHTVYSGCQNQEACENAKVATYAGAAVGTVATVVAVAMVGGMAVGATTLIVAPIVAAAAAGGATYWWFAHNLKNGQP